MLLFELAAVHHYALGKRSLQSVYNPRISNTPIMPHIMKMLGTSWVTVEGGKVVDVGKSRIKWCPLFDKIHGTHGFADAARIQNIYKAWFNVAETTIVIH